jgi:hypothetical protein
MQPFGRSSGTEYNGEASKTASALFPSPQPSPQGPKERGNHSPALSYYDRAWLSCGSEKKAKEAGTATVTSVHSSTVPALSLSSGPRGGLE